MSTFVIRPAQAEDTAAIFSLIQALADYENLSDHVTGSPSDLAQHLFGDRPLITAIVATTPDQIIGFALYFYNYSTFLTKPGLYLEDLFVLPEYRGKGVGKALLTELAKIAIAQNCGRLEWSVLDWNESAIAFYQRMGATVLPDWRICRVVEETLPQMANS
jgi:GNAT superfamily N-acetyltransferase